jgi:DNA invertase Pin-like site-specific DNA recombinase
VSLDLTANATAPQPPATRAAEYVRMSTEHQQYSTGNQQAKTRAVTQTPPGMVTSNSSTFRSELSKP